MKRAIIIVIVLAVVGGGVFALTKQLQAAGAATGKIQYKVAKAKIDQVKKTVSATGALQPWKVIDIKSKAGGKVLTMPVDVGTEVKKGAVLATIDPADTLLSVNTSQADISSARARTQQSKEQQKLQVIQTSIGIQTAQAALESMKASLDAARTREATAKVAADTQPDLTKAAINVAQANLDQAKQNRAGMEATNPQQEASAQAAYDQAKANAKNAESNLKRQKSLLIQGFVSQQVVDSAQASYEVAIAQQESAKKKLDTIHAELAADTNAAEQRIAQADAQYRNALAMRMDVPNKQRAYKEAVAARKQLEAQVKQSEEALNQARANVANNSIKQLDVTSAQAQIARAQASYQNAKITLDQTTVTAPVDGVVLKKYVEEGTIISSALGFAATGNNMLQLGDTTRMYVDVTVDETDIANIDQNQAVDVTFDAYPSTPFEGKVIRIDPQAEVVQNVTTVHVRVEVDNSQAAYKLLKPGMNATCEFIIDKKENVLAVPAEAVRTDDKGAFVEIATGGKPAPVDPKIGGEVDPNTLIDCAIKRVDVKTGLEGNDLYQIAEGQLKADDQVVTQKIEPVVQATSSPFGGGGMSPRGFAQQRTGGGAGGGGARR